MYSQKIPRAELSTRHGRTSTLYLSNINSGVTEFFAPSVEIKKTGVLLHN